LKCEFKNKSLIRTSFSFPSISKSVLFSGIETLRVLTYLVKIQLTTVNFGT
jgi:hypothetical protein